MSLEELLEKLKQGIEVWRWVPGYKEWYKVSTFGRVKSVYRKYKGKRYSGVILKGRIDHRYGHLQVLLTKNGVPKDWKVQRLVLLTFVGQCPEGMESRHFPDRNPANNRIYNLSWATLSQNQMDRAFHGTSNRGEQCARSKLTKDQVLEIRRLQNYKSRSELGRIFNVTTPSILQIIQRKTWKHI